MEGENNRRREPDCRSIAFGSTVLVVGGTRLERECQMEAPLPVDEFIGEIVEAIRAEQLKTTLASLRELPFLSLTEVQRLEGKEATSTILADLLMYRYHHNLKTVLGMKEIPSFLREIFPLE